MWRGLGSSIVLAGALGLGAAAVASLVSPGGAARLDAQHRSLEPDPGDLLIASRELQDPNFAGSVVLLLATGPGGAGGVIINRPTPLRVATALPQIEALQERSDRLWRGGPVEPESAMILVRGGEAPAGGVAVLDGVWAVRTREGIETLLEDDIDPERLRVFAGYAGWAAGQLEWEISIGSWHLRPAEARWIFDTDPAETWEQLLKLATSPVV